MNKKLQKYLNKKNKEYHKRGFDNYRDVEKLAEKTKLGDKEIKRCQFLLKIWEEIEELTEKEIF